MGGDISKEIFKPSDSTYALDFEGLIWIPSRDPDGEIPRVKRQEIPAVYYEWRDNSPEVRTPNFTAIYVSGPETDLGIWNRWLRELTHLLKINILAFDTMGTGLYHGVGGEKQFLDDLCSVYSWLRIEKGISPHRILFWGRGIGTGPVVQLAAALSQLQHQPGKRGLFSRFRHRPVRVPLTIPAELLPSPLASETSTSQLLGSHQLSLPPSSSSFPSSSTATPLPSSHSSATPSSALLSASSMLLPASSTPSTPSPSISASSPSPLPTATSFLSLHAVPSSEPPPRSPSAPPRVPSESLLGGIILQSPMTSILGLVASGGHHDMFENLKYVDKITFPTIIIHGAADDIIPIKHSRKIVQKLRPLEISPLTAFYLVEGAGHDDLESPQYIDELIDPVLRFAALLEEMYELPPMPQSQLSAPPAYFVAPTIEEWCASVGYPQYAPSLIMLGYSDPLFFDAHIDSDLLLSVGISNPDHRDILVARILETVSQHNSSAASAFEASDAPSSSSTPSPTRDPSPSSTPSSSPSSTSPTSIITATSSSPSTSTTTVSTTPSSTTPPLSIPSSPFRSSSRPLALGDVPSGVFKSTDNMQRVSGSLSGSLNGSTGSPLPHELRTSGKILSLAVVGRRSSQLTNSNTSNGTLANVPASTPSPDSFSVSDDREALTMSMRDLQADLQRKRTLMRHTIFTKHSFDSVELDLAKEDFAKEDWCTAFRSILKSLSDMVPVFHGPSLHHAHPFVPESNEAITRPDSATTRVYSWQACYNQVPVVVSCMMVDPGASSAIWAMVPKYTAMPASVNRPTLMGLSVWSTSELFPALLSALSGELSMQFFQEILACPADSTWLCMIFEAPGQPLKQYILQDHTPLDALSLAIQASELVETCERVGPPIISLSTSTLWLKLAGAELQLFLSPTAFLSPCWIASAPSAALDPGSFACRMEADRLISLGMLLWEIRTHQVWARSGCSFDWTRSLEPSDAWFPIIALCLTDAATDRPSIDSVCNRLVRLQESLTAHKNSFSNQLRRRRSHKKSTISKGTHLKPLPDEGFLVPDHGLPEGLALKSTKKKQSLRLKFKKRAQSQLTDYSDRPAFNSPAAADIIFLVGPDERVFFAHSAILTEKCIFFANFFRSSDTPSDHWKKSPLRVPLLSSSPEAMSLWLKELYSCGSAPPSFDPSSPHLKEFQFLSKRFLVSGAFLQHSPNKLLPSYTSPAFSDQFWSPVIISPPPTSPDSASSSPRGSSKPPSPRAASKPVTEPLPEPKGDLKPSSKGRHRTTSNPKNPKIGKVTVEIIMEE